MVTKKVIDSLYKLCKDRPESPDELDIALLFEDVADTHALELDEGHLTINSLPPNSPFHKIALKRIHGIINFEEEFAIVLHSSIIFLKKKEAKVNVHIRQTKASFMDMIRSKLHNPEKETDENS